MRRPLLLPVIFALAIAPVAAQDTAFIAVSYVETIPSAKKDTVAAFAQYREASRKLGATTVELFEQTGRPGHWTVIEKWTSQTAFDGRDAAVQKQLLQSLESSRVSGYDQRPYKPLALDDRPTAARVPRDAVWVISHVDTSPSPQVPDLLRRLATASRQEAGSLRFDVTQHTMRANHFTVIEAWASQKALDAHAAAAHTKQYRDELQPMTGSPLDERVFTAMQ